MKKQFFYFLACVVLSTSAMGSNLAKVDYNHINAVVVEDFIVKNYAQLARSSIAFNQAVLQACTSGHESNNLRIIDRSLQETFHDLRLAWAKIQLISFGPIGFLERRERLDYWPDKHRVGERQLRQILNKKESIRWTIESFRNKSVAVQGLSAFERILFPKGDFYSLAQRNENRCQLAKLISTNVMEIATEVSLQWSEKPIEFKNDLLNPSPDLTFFANSQEVTSVLLSEMSTQLRFLTDIKIGKTLPSKGKNVGNYRQLESWRTGRSFLLMQTNIETVENYYRQGFSPEIIKFDPKLHQSIIRRFTDALEIVRSLNMQTQLSMKQLLMKQDNLNKLKNLQSLLLGLDTSFKKEIVGLLNLNIKFNALDGD